AHSCLTPRQPVACAGGSERCQTPPRTTPAQGHRVTLAQATPSSRGCPILPRDVHDRAVLMTTLPNRTNTALLVVDVQNGAVADAHERDTVVANIAGLVERARSESVPV